MRQSGWGTWGWFAVRTAPRREMTVAQELRELGLRAFVPVEIVKVRKGRGNERTRPKEIERPFFTGYLFTQAAMDIQTWLRIKNHDYVYGVVSGNPDGRPTPVPDAAMSHLIAAGPFRPEGPKAGETVRLSTGPFSGLITKIVKVDRNERITVLLPFMGTDRPVVYNLSDVERQSDGSAALATA